MNEKWYQGSGPDSDIVIASRVRLLRNYGDVLFPGKMDPSSRETVHRNTGAAVLKLKDREGRSFSEIPVSGLNKEERAALYERQVMNRSAFLCTEPFSLYVSRNEDFSVTLNVTDHVRLLASCRGLRLPALYERVHEAELTLSEERPYAFDEKLGFVTSGIRDLGTGMRAYSIVHLPLLSAGKGFRKLCQDLGRYGVLIREAWTGDAAGAGGLYVLYNQRTLGLTEQEILAFVSGVTARITENERNLREHLPKIKLLDMVCRSLGILERSRLIDLKEACRHLSALLLGESMGFLRPDPGLSLYELMLGIFPGNLQTGLQAVLTEEEMREKRADILRSRMSGISITE